MRILVKVGYYDLLLGKTDNLQAVAEAFGGAQEVEKVGGYGSNIYAIKERQEERSLSFLPDDSLQLPENTDAPQLEEIARLSKALSAANSEKWKLESELKKLKEKFAPFMSDEKEEKK